MNPCNRHHSDRCRSPWTTSMSWLPLLLLRKWSFTGDSAPRWEWTQRAPIAPGSLFSHFSRADKLMFCWKMQQLAKKVQMSWVELWLIFVVLCESVIYRKTILKSISVQSCAGDVALHRFVCHVRLFRLLRIGKLSRAIRMVAMNSVWLGTMSGSTLSRVKASFLDMQTKNSMMYA